MPPQRCTPGLRFANPARLPLTPRFPGTSRVSAALPPSQVRECCAWAPNETVRVATALRVFSFRILTFSGEQGQLVNENGPCGAHYDKLHVSHDGWRGADRAQVCCGRGRNTPPAQLVTTWCFRLLGEWGRAGGSCARLRGGRSVCGSGVSSLCLFRGLAMGAADPVPDHTRWSSGIW